MLFMLNGCEPMYPYGIIKSDNEFINKKFEIMKQISDLMSFRLMIFTICRSVRQGRNDDQRIRELMIEYESLLISFITLITQMSFTEKPQYSEI